MLGPVADASDSSHLFRQLIHNARVIRRDIRFHYYQLAEGITKTLAYARKGIKKWIPIRDKNPRQLTLKLMY